jgi:cytochrome c oxidase assembly protein subunit 15
MNNSKRQIILWLYSGCILIFAMVVIGGVTRLTGSGLSITEWKLVTGTFPPVNDIQWQEEFSEYQQSPQFQKINSAFGIDEFKNIYWWEYIHRLLGRLIGIVFIVPFVYFYLKKQIDKKLLPKLVVIFLLGALQGFLGWYMVKSGLVDNPYVSHYRLAIHLITAFITFGYLFWVIEDLKSEEITEKSKTHKGVLQLSILTFGLVLIQIIYGGFVAGLHAGYAYNTWPMMGDEWVAASVSMAFEKNGITSLFDNLATVQFIHRTVAILIFSLILYVWLKRNNAGWNLSAGQKTSISLSFYLATIQVLIGIYTLIYSVPFWSAVLHQAGGFAVFAAIILQVHRLARG